MTQKNLTNPIFLFIILLFIVTVNTIGSAYFLLIMMVGILFNSFYICLKNRYIYSLLFVIFTFLFIEISSGLKPFSLSLLSLFIYVFTIPKIEKAISITTINGYLYILFFYIGVIIIWLINFNYNENIIYILLANMLLDLIFFGLFL